MKKLILASALIVAMSSPAYAAYQRTARTSVEVDANTTKYTYAPITGYWGWGDNVGDESRIDNLDHNSYYTWGMDLNIDFSDVTITSASITFVQIQNWDDNDYDLWVRLLDHDRVYTNAAVRDGIRKYTDYNATGDALDGNGILLHNFVKPEIPGSSDSPTTITYDFTIAQLAKLTDYAALFDGIIGLGFDPDCHFWNEGVTFSLTTSSQTSEVPEPATMLLFGTGLAGLAGLRMRRKKR